MIQKYLYGIILVVFFACTSTKESSQTTVEKTPETKAPEAAMSPRVLEVLASIERTACYGQCPTYKAIVYTTGKVIYEGKMNVSRKGTYEAMMTQKQMDYLLAKAEMINYFELEKSYDGNITDIPACLTTVKSKDKAHSIYNRYKGPEELESFQKDFDKLLDSLKWTMVASPEHQEDDAD